MKRAVLTALAIAAVAGPEAAQDTSVGGSSVVTTYPPGWAFTPSFRFASMGDDNISLFSVSNGTNGDFLSTYSPAAELRYTGRQTRFDAGYGGSLLTYHTFSAL